jgi:hypothetical protein
MTKFMGEIANRVGLLDKTFLLQQGLAHLIDEEHPQNTRKKKKQPKTARKTIS